MEEDLKLMEFYGGEQESGDPKKKKKAEKAKMWRKRKHGRG